MSDGPADRPTPKAPTPRRLRSAAEVKSFRAADADKASEWLGAAYGGATKVQPLHSASLFAMDILAVGFGDAEILRARISDCRISGATGEFAYILVPIQGALTFGSGARAVVVEAHVRAVASPPFGRIVIEVPSGEVLALCARGDGLVERAERLTGLPCDASLIDEMADAIDMRAPVAQALVRTMKSAILATVNLDAVGLRGLALSGYEDLILNIATTVLFPRVAKHLGEAPLDCGSEIVRRARDFIVAHADEVIELSRLARKLGVSMRALQAGFQKNFGLSPRRFISECRLERVRKELLHSAATGGITEIALRYGFSNQGHFSAKYRDRYGELPSETLRRVARK